MNAQIMFVHQNFLGVDMTKNQIGRPQNQGKYPNQTCFQQSVHFSSIWNEKDIKGAIVIFPYNKKWLSLTRKDVNFGW